MIFFSLHFTVRWSSGVMTGSGKENDHLCGQDPARNNRWASADLMLAQRRRRWANIGSAPGEPRSQFIAKVTSGQFWTQDGCCDTAAVCFVPSSSRCICSGEMITAPVIPRRRHAPAIIITSSKCGISCNLKWRALLLCFLSFCVRTIIYELSNLIDHKFYLCNGVISTQKRHWNVE